MRHFRHLPNRPGHAPTESERRVYEAVRREVATMTGPLPRVVVVDGRHAVTLSETWDEQARAPAIGLAVELGRSST